MVENVINPDSLRLEASSACQLRCPSCPTTTGAAWPVVGRGWLKASDFSALLDANPQVRRIELSNYGEIFVNPQLEEILRLAHERGVALQCDNGVNLNDVSERVLEALVRYGVRSLSCSIDGATPAVYKQYRVRGDFDRVIANIRTINRFKAQYKSSLPLLRWVFIAFGHNEHEIEAARRLATELGMEFYVKLSWDADFSPVLDADAVRKASGTGSATREEFRERHGRDYLEGICGQLWHSPQINWDGKVLGCCRNFWGEFGGNAFSDGVHAAVNSERMQYARRMLIGEAPAREDIPCTRCELYRGRASTHRWMKIAVAPVQPR